MKLALQPMSQRSFELCSVRNGPCARSSNSWNVCSVGVPATSYALQLTAESAMYIIRRWWARHSLQLVLVFLALSAAWTIRQTQGSAIFEIYQLITRPFKQFPLKQSGRMMP